MGGRGSLSGIGYRNKLSGLDNPKVFRSVVRDEANQILMNIPSPEAVQIIIKKSYKNGVPTVQLIENTMVALNNTALTYEKVSYWMRQLHREITRNQKIASWSDSGGLAYKQAKVQISAAMQVMSGLRKLAKEKKVLGK